MNSLHRSLSHAAVAPLDSQQLVQTLATREREVCIAAPEETPIEKHHPFAPAPGPPTAGVYAVNGDADCAAGADGASEAPEGCAVADNTNVGKFTCAGSVERRNESTDQSDLHVDCCKGAKSGGSGLSPAALDAAAEAGLPTTSTPRGDASRGDFTREDGSDACEPHVAAPAPTKEGPTTGHAADIWTSAPPAEDSGAPTGKFSSESQISQHETSSQSALAKCAYSERSPTPNGSTRQESARQLSLGESKDLTTSGATPSSSVPRAEVSGLEEAVQPPKRDSSCDMPAGAATANQEDSDHVQERLRRRGRDTQAAARVCRVTAARASSWSSNRGSFHPAQQRQVPLQDLLPPSPEESTTYDSSQTQNSPAQLVSTAGAAAMHQRGFRSQHQCPTEPQGRRVGPQPLQEEAIYPGCEATPRPQRGLRRLLAHNSNVSATEAAQQKSCPPVVAEACEAVCGDPARLLAPTLPASNLKASLPAWPQWTFCPPVGSQSAAPPPPSLLYLQQHLQKHLSAGWPSGLSLPAFYPESGHSGAEALTSFDGHDASLSPVGWTEAAHQLRGSYSPGGLWHPAPPGPVPEGVQRSLQMGESVNLEHTNTNCNNYSSDGYRAQRWLHRGQAESPYRSASASFQAAAWWLQEAHHDSTEGHETQQYVEYSDSNRVAECTSSAVMSSPLAVGAKGPKSSPGWPPSVVHERHPTEKADCMRDRNSSMYRWQLLQQLVLRYNQQAQRQQDGAMHVTQGDGGVADSQGKRRPTKRHDGWAAQLFCTDEGTVARRDCDSSAPAGPNEEYLPQAYDAAPTWVTFPSDRSHPVSAAAQVQRTPMDYDPVNGNAPPDYTCMNVAQASRSEEHMKRCIGTAGAHRPGSVDTAADHFSTRQPTQWVAPPPEAAAALAAARAAAASAAAAIAAEWQQHLEQHYLEDWMRQLPPAHQWWLLHLQQTDHLSRRNIPLYGKEWQDVDLEPNAAMCAAVDADARSVAKCAALQMSQPQQQPLHDAEDDGWETSLSAYQPWEPHMSEAEQQMPSAPWTASLPASMSPAVAVARGGEGFCWPYVFEAGIQREQQPMWNMDSSSRQRIPGGRRRGGRTDGPGQIHGTLGEPAEHWKGDTADPLGIPPWGDTVAAKRFPPRLALQQRQVPRATQRSTARLGVYGHGGECQQPVREQAQHSTPNHVGRRWRRTCRDRPTEACSKAVLLSVKSGAPRPRRASACAPCCLDVATSCSCSSCTLQAPGAGGGRRTRGKRITSAEFACLSQVRGPCRTRSAREGESRFGRSTLRCERKAAERDPPAIERRASRRGSAIEQPCSFLHPDDTQRLITRSCCPPNPRRVLGRGARRRRGSQGGTQREGTSTPGESVSSFALEGGQALRRVPHNEELVDLGAEEPRRGGLLSNCCSSRQAAGNLTAVLGDQVATDGKLHFCIARPKQSCFRGENCEDPAKTNTKRPAGSPPVVALSARNRPTERLHAALQRQLVGVNSRKCRVCPGGSRPESSTGVFGCSKRGNGGGSSSNSSRYRGDCRRHEEMQTSVAAKTRRAQRKHALRHVGGEGATDLLSSCDRPAAFNTVYAAPPSSRPLLRVAEQRETEATATERRDRRLKGIELALHGAQKQRTHSCCTAECRRPMRPGIAAGSTCAVTGSESSRTGLPGSEDTSCRPSARTNTTTSSRVPQESSVEPQMSVATGARTSSSSRRRSDAVKIQDEVTSTGNTDNLSGRTPALKTRSWLTVAREAAEKPAV